MICHKNSISDLLSIRPSFVCNLFTNSRLMLFLTTFLLLYLIRTFFNAFKNSLIFTIPLIYSFINSIIVLVHLYLLHMKNIAGELEYNLHRTINLDFINQSLISNSKYVSVSSSNIYSLKSFEHHRTTFLFLLNQSPTHFFSTSWLISNPYFTYWLLTHFATSISNPPFDANFSI